MRPRPPTQREKKRYLLFTVTILGPPAEPRDVASAIHESVTALFGDAGAAGIHATLILTVGDAMVVRCRRGSERMLAAALVTIGEIGGRSVGIRTIAISGTIRGVMRHIPPPAQRLPWTSGEIEVEGRTFTVIGGESNADGRIDLIEKGFNRQELLFLTREDI